MSDVVKSLMPTLAVMTDAEKAELRALLPAEDEGEPDPTRAEWEAHWVAECERRMAAIDRGEMALIDADEVDRRIEARLAAIQAARS